MSYIYEFIDYNHNKFIHIYTNASKDRNENGFSIFPRVRTFCISRHLNGLNLCNITGNTNDIYHYIAALSPQMILKDSYFKNKLSQRVINYRQLWKKSSLRWFRHAQARSEIKEQMERSTVLHGYHHEYNFNKNYNQ